VRGAGHLAQGLQRIGRRGPGFRLGGRGHGFVARRREGRHRTAESATAIKTFLNMEILRCKDRTVCFDEDE
jgi:hypothetical protein